jgi:hypothetical protein
LLRHSNARSRYLLTSPRVMLNSNMRAGPSPPPQAAAAKQPVRVGLQSALRACSMACTFLPLRDCPLALRRLQTSKPPPPPCGAGVPRSGGL